MSQPLYLTSARLATNDRLPDRFLRSGLVAADGPNTETLGHLLYVIEVQNPLYADSKVTDLIVSTLTEAYFQAEVASGSALYRFEQAARSVNQALADLTKTGETDWIGNLHAVLGAIVERELLLAQTGTARAYLFRQYKISHITEGLSTERAPHPLKTFSNLVSGKLTEGDRLVVANQTLFDYLPLDQLRQLLLSGPPRRAAEQIARTLRREHVKAVGAITCQLDEEPHPEEPPIVIYLDQPGRQWLQQGLTATMPLAKRTVAGMRAATIWAGPKVAVSWQKLRSFKPAVGTALSSRHSTKSYAPRPKHGNNTKSTSVDAQSIWRETVALLRLPKLTAFWRAHETTWLKNRRRPILLLLGAILLLLIFVLLIRFNHKQGKPAAATTSASSSQASDLITAGSQALANNDETTARAKAMEASLALSKLLPGDQATIRSALATLTDQLDHITRLSDVPAALNLGDKNIATLYADDKVTLLYEPKSGTVWQWTGGKLSPQTTLAPPPTALTIARNNQELYGFDQSGKLWNLSKSPATPVTLAGQSRWSSQVLDFGFFQSNLYLLDQSATITKISVVDGVFSASTTYMKNGHPSPDAQAMTIPSSIWLLGKSQLEQWTRGSQTKTVALASQPALADTTWTGLTTDGSTLFATTKQGHVIEFGGDGATLKHLAIPVTLGQPTVSTVDATHRALWAVVGGSLYKFNLPN